MVYVWREPHDGLVELEDLASVLSLAFALVDDVGHLLCADKGYAELHGL